MVPELNGTVAEPTDRLSATFAALAHPARRAILARLVQGDASVAELAAPFDMSVRAVSKHVGVLQRAGLVNRGREAQRRPSSVQAAPLREVHDWLEGYRGLWEGRLDRIGKLLDAVNKPKLK